ncbi:MAG: hypothetical protein WEB88_14935 [Gemmatimonadota bacterium]
MSTLSAAPPRKQGGAGQPETATAATPSIRTVLRRQLALIAHTRGRAMFTFVLMGGLAILLMPETLFDAQSTTLAAGFILGGVWALGVWSGEAPSERVYHRMLPVGRRRHDLLRVLAGLGWLLAMLAVVYTVGGTRLMTSWHPEHVAQAGGVWQIVPGRYWINLLTAPLTTYLAVSAFAVAVERPGLWMVLTLGASLGLLRLAEFLELGPLRAVLHFLLAGPHGLGEALVGTVGYVPIIGGQTPPDRWLYAALAWLALAALGVILSSRVYRDVR